MLRLFVITASITLMKTEAQKCDSMSKVPQWIKGIAVLYSFCLKTPLYLQETSSFFFLFLKINW